MQPRPIPPASPLARVNPEAGECEQDFADKVRHRAPRKTCDRIGELREVIAVVVGRDQEPQPVAVLLQVDLVGPTELLGDLGKVDVAQAFLLDLRDFGESGDLISIPVNWRRNGVTRRKFYPYRRSLLLSHCAYQQ